MTVGQGQIVRLDATDPEGADVTYSIVSVDGTPWVESTAEGDFTLDGAELKVETSRPTGNATVIVQASDGSLTTNQTLTITVVEGGTITASGTAITLEEEQTYGSEGGGTDVSTGISVSEPVDVNDATFDNFSGFVTNDDRFTVDSDGNISIKAGSEFNLEGGDDEPLITVDGDGTGTFTLTVEAQVTGGVTVASTEIAFDITDIAELDFVQVGKEPVLDKNRYTYRTEAELDDDGNVIYGAGTAIFETVEVPTEAEDYRLIEEVLEDDDSSPASTHTVTWVMEDEYKEFGIKALSPDFGAEDRDPVTYSVAAADETNANAIANAATLFTVSKGPDTTKVADDPLDPYEDYIILTYNTDGALLDYDNLTALKELGWVEDDEGNITYDLIITATQTVIR